ncbi:TadE/TadG family type IV pilus assembly protein [Puniceibacterium sp. IMCC21224]|uniref:TadE/TadG family type IV pilus assembly protein n=1 Tax=Puniceibacterium sp. IMCC21224 TaxID=1618204 RepID=UPI00064DE8E5|nr:hypothetical protein [Puniceibacterium sp. IMCC21224]KMK66334.1 hypothetical protein IMCC21224_111184 [Puniceibacterium sp. IMCC21224]
MLNQLKARLRRFSDDTDGYITVEAMIVLPVLLWLFGASWVYFDAFRQQGVNQKANYTIGDMISRETDPLDDEYIDNTRDLLYLLNKSQGNESDLRITIVRYDGGSDGYDVVWSEARGNYGPLDDADMRDYADRLPVMAHNDQVILVETWDDYHSAMQVGLDDFEIKTYSFTRPRFAPQVMYVGDSGNNSWGGGDPDGSFCDTSHAVTTCSNEDGSNNIEPSGA